MPNDKRVLDSDFVQASRNRMTKMGIDEDIFPNNGPRKEDVRQGYNGSCYMLGPMRRLADKNPEYIKNLIKDNKDGTVTVTFYDLDGPRSKGPIKVTIDKSLPKTDRQSAPWLRLLEKAYVASQLKSFDRYMNPLEGIDMKNLGWFTSDMFQYTINPNITKDTDITPQFYDFQDPDDAREYYTEFLTRAANESCFVSISTEIHSMQLEEVKKDENDGKTYVYYYDQWKDKHHRISMDEMLSPSSPITDIFIDNFQPVETNIHCQLMPKGEGRILQELHGELKATPLSDTLQQLFENAISAHGNAAPTLFKNKSAAELLLKGKDYNKFIEDEVARFHNKLNLRDLKNALKPGADYRKEILGKLCDFVAAHIDNIEDPDVKTAIINGIPQFKAAVAKETKVTKQLTEAEKERNARLQEKGLADFEKCCRELNESAANTKDNSPEYTAMVEALNDLQTAMKEHPDSEIIPMLQERAFAKCNYYQSHKNPHFAAGKARKNNAIKAMNVLRKLDPEIASKVFSNNRNIILAETAANLIGENKDRATRINGMIEALESPDNRLVFENMLMNGNGQTGFDIIDETCKSEGLKNFVSKINVAKAASVNQQDYKLRGIKPSQTVKQAMAEELRKQAALADRYNERLIEVDQNPKLSPEERKMAFDIAGNEYEMAQIVAGMMEKAENKRGPEMDALKGSMASYIARLSANRYMKDHGEIAKQLSNDKNIQTYANKLKSTSSLDNLVNKLLENPDSFSKLNPDELLDFYIKNQAKQIQDEFDAQQISEHNKYIYTEERGAMYGKALKDTRGLTFKGNWGLNTNLCLQLKEIAGDLDGMTLDRASLQAISFGIMAGKEGISVDDILSNAPEMKAMRVKCAKEGAALAIGGNAGEIAKHLYKGLTTLNEYLTQYAGQLKEFTTEELLKPEFENAIKANEMLKDLLQESKTITQICQNKNIELPYSPEELENQRKINNALSACFGNRLMGAQKLLKNCTDAEKNPSIKSGKIYRDTVPESIKSEVANATLKSMMALPQNQGKNPVEVANSQEYASTSQMISLGILMSPEYQEFNKAVGFNEQMAEKAIYSMVEGTFISSLNLQVKLDPSKNPMGFSYELDLDGLKKTIENTVTKDPLANSKQQEQPQAEVSQTKALV